MIKYDERNTELFSHVMCATLTPPKSIYTLGKKVIQRDCSRFSVNVFFVHYLHMRKTSKLQVANVMFSLVFELRVRVLFSYLQNLLVIGEF